MVACGNPVQPGTQPPVGTWGGLGVRIDVSVIGATIEYDCAHGTIDQPIVADRDGRFSVTGTHIREHGGPIRVDETPDRHPARYDGQVTGNSMRLSVTLTDSNQMIGPFDATLNGSPRVVKCL